MRTEMNELDRVLKARVRTLEARVERWLALSQRLAQEIDQLPQLRELYDEFQVVVANAQSLRDRLVALRTQTDATLDERDAAVSAGDDLFTRLSLGLRAVYGPQSERLYEFGLKPLGRNGRPKKASPSADGGDA